MYKKSVQGWLKHLDFMILDVVCLWISFTLAFNMRHGCLMYWRILYTVI